MMGNSRRRKTAEEEELAKGKCAEAAVDEEEEVTKRDTKPSIFLEFLVVFHLLSFLQFLE